MERRGILATAGDWAWFLVFAVASSVWCVTAAAQLGATFDEPVYVERGLQGWRNGTHSGLLRMGTMPLPTDLDTLPLYLWERWHGLTFDPGRRGDQPIGAAAVEPEMALDQAVELARLGLRGLAVERDHVDQERGRSQAITGVVEAARLSVGSNNIGNELAQPV